MTPQLALTDTGTGTGTPSPHRAVRLVRGLIDRVHGLGREVDDTVRVELLRALEELRCAAAGEQAVITAAFVSSQREQAAQAGERAEDQERGIASQVALARRESTARGRVHVALARVLVAEMPHTLDALRRGRITERAAQTLVRETSCLTLDHRRLVDESLAGGEEAQTELARTGERRLADLVRGRAARLDPASVAQRRRLAERQRRTSLRPAPDTMTWFGALLPVKDGVSVHAVLAREADRLRGLGDERSRGQIMADTLVDRVVRPSLPDVSAGPSTLPLMVNVVVPDSVLLGDRDTGEAWVEGYGATSGDLVRQWLAESLDADTAAATHTWLRRLYARPEVGQLVAMDSRARRFTGHLAGFLRLRDRACRTPWCDAPVRHLDHVVDHAESGPTTATNAQGLCEACNYAKQAHGWSARPRPGPRHTVETTTPTGHTYTSVAPATECVGPTGSRQGRQTNSIEPRAG